MADHTSARPHAKGVADPADLEAELDRLREENEALRLACIAARAATEGALERLSSRMAMISTIATMPVRRRPEIDSSDLIALRRAVEDEDLPAAWHDAYSTLKQVVDRTYDLAEAAFLSSGVPEPLGDPALTEWEDRNTAAREQVAGDCLAMRDSILELLEAG